jgi:hypothetical protein
MSWNIVSKSLREAAAAEPLLKLVNEWTDPATFPVMKFAQIDAIEFTHAPAGITWPAVLAGM